MIAPDRRLAIALAGAGGLVVAGAATRLARPPIPGETPGDLLPLLVAMAAVLGAAVLRARSPGLAWALASGGAFLAVHEPVVLAGTLQGSGSGGEAWLPAATLVTLASTTACAVAALYATRVDAPSRGIHLAAWSLVGWQALAGCVSIGIGLARRHDDPAGPPLLHVLTAPVAYWPVVPLILLAAGVGADLPAVAGAIGDELLGRAESRRATERRERARLAAELHADVLPALRAALADLEAGRDPALVGARLAAIAADVQALTLERRNLIVEELGLVAALEALAERSEERGIATVEIDVLDPDLPRAAADGAVPARPPVEVERAALRVAELAVANAARHGSGTVRMRIAAGPSAIRLEIANDGPPFDPIAAREAVRHGARGLTEMREAAAGIDATLDIGAGPDGGTVVQLAWPAAH